MGKRESYCNGDVSLGQSAGHWVACFDHVGKRKRKRLLPIARPETEARAALDRFADARRAVLTTQSSRTIGDLWKLWLAERAKDGFSNDIYSAQWKALAPFWANRAPDQVQRDDWREYARQRFALGRAPATVHTELSRLSVCLKWATETRLIAFRPKHWLPQKGKPRSRVLTPDEAQALVRAARDGDPHIEVFVVLLFATGGRHKAVLDLEWSRVDFVAGTINLEVDLPPDPMHKTWRKGRANLVMSRMARAALERAYAIRTCESVVEHGGKRLKTCREGFANACDRAGLEGVTPHTIRHTVASWTKGKVATEFTAALLGHADEATTRLNYMHTSAEHTRPAVDVIDATFATLPHFDEKPAPKRSKSREKPRPMSIVDKRQNGTMR